MTTEQKIIFRTFDEWYLKGMTVIKGEKGTKINDKWMFSSEQVKEMHPSGCICSWCIQLWRQS